MVNIIPITEHFQHFVEEVKESFWGDLQAKRRGAATKFFELLSDGQRDRYLVSGRYSRSSPRKDQRNRNYLRDLVTRFGTLRLRIARSRKRGFLPERSLLCNSSFVVLCVLCDLSLFAVRAQLFAV